MADKTVADPSDEVAAMQPAWDLLYDLMGGTTSMRRAGKKHLPQWPNEDPKSYEARLSCAVLFAAVQRTVNTLASKPFSEPVTIGDDVPGRIKEWLNDVDLQGRNLDAFAGDVIKTQLGPGLGGILVDYPRDPKGVRTLAEEQAAGLRPYMVHIKPSQLRGWQISHDSGVWRFTQLRFMECVEVPGTWDSTKVDQIRVLEPGKWQTHRKDAKGEWQLFEEGVTTLGYIPFIPVYGERDGFMSAKPPLLECAHLNVAHWQSASDQQTILHVARVPILAVTGVQDGLGPDGKPQPWKLTIGASAAVKLPVGADMKYVEHTGAAIAAGAADLEKIEERMRQLGAELLVLKPGHITATQVATENAVGMSALHRIALTLEDALDKALGIMADWVNLGQPGGHVTLFKDFGAASLAEASTQILLGATTAGKLSDETFFAEMQRRGIISPDIDWETEKERIAAQGPALGMIQPGGSGGGGIPTNNDIGNANQDQ